MEELYRLTLNYDLLERTFYTKLSLAEFLELMQKAHLYAVEHDRELVGYTWLNMFWGNSAAVHVCLFPVVSARAKIQAAKEFCRFVLCARLGKQFYKDSLVALVPETHKHVMSYAMATGLRYLGAIPKGVTVMGEYVDLSIFIIERTDLEED